MIKLHQFRPAWGLTTASPFCQKLETYLRMAGIEHQVVVERDTRRAPKGKLPYIEEADGRLLGAEVVGPEVVEAGALDRCGADRIDGQLGGDGLAVLDRHPLGVVQHRVGEVVDS